MGPTSPSLGSSSVALSLPFLLPPFPPSPFSPLPRQAVDNKLTALERAQFAGGSRRPIKVLVVGAGYSGVELSCVVAERLGARGQVQVRGDLGAPAARRLRTTSYHGRERF